VTIPFEDDKVRKEKGVFEKGEVMRKETEIRDGRVSPVRMPYSTRRRRGKEVWDPILNCMA
jgi:hypothetical protein